MSVTVSEYTQDATLESAVGAAISLMVVAMMMKMVKGTMDTAGPMYAKKHQYFGMTTQVEFESLLTKLTKYDLSNMRTELYHVFNSYPSHSYGNKAADVAEFTYWARGDSDRTKAIMDMARKILDKKANTITSGPVPNTKYVMFSELTKSPNYPMIEPAIWFGYNEGSGNVNNPVTKDGYVSVYALYNINRWASWKSSSLSASEREVAGELDKLIPYDLLKLNGSRKKDQPALFPDNMLAKVH